MALKTYGVNLSMNSFVCVCVVNIHERRYCVLDSFFDVESQDLSNKTITPEYGRTEPNSTNWYNDN